MLSGHEGIFGEATHHSSGGCRARSRGHGPLPISLAEVIGTLRAACHKGETMLSLPFIGLAASIVFGLLAGGRFPSLSLVDVTS